MVKIRKRWSPEEEAALRAGVDKYGIGKWNAILKDRELGVILILRSNVDLKDKWRNIERDGVICALGDAPNTGKQRDMSLSIGASEFQVIDAKPLTVLIGTSTAPEPSCIKGPNPRLNNPILDAKAKAKETYGYSNTAIVPYVEKRAAELQITVGKEVEVSFKKDDYSIWFPATVLEDFEDNSYLVRYLGKKGTKASSRGAIVSLPDIRPQPPPHNSRSFVLLDKVDAFCGVAWTRGLIIKEFTDKRFMISFKHFENQVFSETELRPHMEWVNGKWVDASKSREAYNNAQLGPSKKYKIVNAAENPTSTACETDTMNSTPSSKQHSSQETKTSTSIVCLTDVAVTETPGKGHSSLKTDIKVTNEKNIGELSDASKDVKKRGRPPKIYGNSTSAPENVKRRRTPKIKESSTSGGMNSTGVKAAEGIKERGCEKEHIAPGPQDSISCELPIDGSQTITSDQKGQGHVSARLIIKERADNSLSNHSGTSPELLEPRDRMELPMKSSEMVKRKVSIGKLFKCYVREGGKRSADLSTETPHLIRDGKVSNAGVGTAEGTEEKDCESQDTPILFGCKGTRNVQDNNPSQSPAEGFKKFISDQNGQGNVLARQTIKERAKSNLGKQKRTSPELLEPMSRMEKPTELSEKAKCQVSSDKLGKRCLREARTRIAEPFAESPLSVVDGVSLIEIDGKQTFPFEKTVPLWDSIQSMEVFQLYPQKPHFSSLKDIDEDCREGLALAQMVTFSKIVKQISEPNSFTEKVLEKLNMLENNGFDVRMIRDRLKEFLENNLKKQESQFLELKRRKTKIDEEVDEIDRKLKTLRALREAAMSKIEIKEAAIKASKSLLNSINDRIESVQHDFEEVAAAPL